LLALLLAVQTAVGCASAGECRAQAEAAAARGDFEIFHDLAWAAVRKGRPNDPNLMYVLARAQSLSGRPGDAFVMLRRLAELGIWTDAATRDDFASVRYLKDWPALEAKIAAIAAPAAASAPPSTAATRRGEPAAVRAPDAPARPGAHAALAAEPPAPAGALEFESAGLDPIGLAHDGVSRRFVIADRLAPRLVVVDEVSRHVVPFVSAETSGFLDELTAVAIDARRGDLWVASASADGSSALHMLQLVSGRALREVKAPADGGPFRFVALAVARDGTIVALDGAGSRVCRLRPGARSLDVVTRVDGGGLTAVTAAEAGIVYVAGATGLWRVGLASRKAERVRGSVALDGVDSLAWRAGALLGVQRKGDGYVVVRVELDASGERARSRTVLATADRPAVGALGDGLFYYLSGQTIRRVRVR
jgi:hypothetical protein